MLHLSIYLVEVGMHVVGFARGSGFRYSSHATATSAGALYNVPNIRVLIVKACRRCVVTNNVQTQQGVILSSRAMCDGSLHVQLVDRPHPFLLTCPDNVCLPL